MNYKYFKNKKLLKVVNIFQKKYSNTYGNGFGDFLRGCIFLLQIAQTYNLRFDIDYNNHIISHFLFKDNDTEKNNKIDYDNVFYIIGSSCIISEKIYKEFIDYLNYANNDILYLYTNNRPMHPISIFQSDLIKNKILPNEILSITIDETMKDMKIIEKQFIVIHIRTGDRFLLCNEVDCAFFEYISTIIKKKLSPDNKYLILSDSNELKKMLKNNFPELIIHINCITHTGEDIPKSDVMERAVAEGASEGGNSVDLVEGVDINTNSEFNSTKNTLVDFFIMSKSNYIHGISVYEHGTGFSDYCSKIFNIGYEFTLIKDDNSHPTRECAI